MWICSQQRRPKRNCERKHVRVLYGSPERVLKWSYSHSPKKQQIPKGGVFWHCPSCSCQGVPNSCLERGSLPGIRNILNSLRSGGALTRNLYVTPLLFLPTILSLCRETWHFPEPREREQRVEHHIYSLLLHCTPNLQRWRLLAYRSLLSRERPHSINFPDESHGSIIKRRCPGTVI